MAILQNITVNDTGYLKIPVGTTSNRPSTPTVGMLRYNSDTRQHEWYNGSEWIQIVPPGIVRYYPLSSTPAGWLKANGATVSRTTYAALFSAIGTTYGAGDGSTTFTLPDLRGHFLRGLDDGRGIDSSRVLGSFQDQDWRSFSQTDTLQNVSSGYSHGPVYMGKTTASFTGTLFTGRYANPSASIGTKWDTSEIRPTNHALLACIKY